MTVSCKLKQILLAAAGAGVLIYTVDAAFATVHTMLLDLFQQSRTQMLRPDDGAHSWFVSDHDDESDQRNDFVGNSTLDPNSTTLSLTVDEQREQLTEFFPKDESSENSTTGNLFQNHSLAANYFRSSENQTSALEEDNDNASLSGRAHQEEAKVQTENSTSISNSILFVHVGKAGGMTIRQSTYLSCLGDSPTMRPAPDDIVAKCAEKFSPDTVLPFRLTYVMHLNVYRTDQMRNASAFLFVLRHPVDRYVSAFYYHHPMRKKCPDCEEVVSQSGRFFRECFPAIEDLAQLGLSPFNVSSDEVPALHVTDPQDVVKCHRVATAIAHAQPVTNITLFALHHFYYNYKFYTSKTVDAYKDKPLYVVRTEYEWEDLVAIDRELGGSGALFNLGSKWTHGSERVKKYSTQLSSSGYHKLCCTLVEEIEIYKSILARAMNLDQNEKQMTLQDAYDKCGITTSWAQWKEKCLQTQEEDRRSVSIDDETS